MRVAHIDGDVALLRPLGVDFGDERFDILEGIGEEQPPPSAIDDGVGFRPLALDIMVLAMGTFEPCLAASVAGARAY